MKTYRLFAALLFALSISLLASAQESSELASLRSKAEKGNGIAQYNLGLAYAEGRGIAADPLEAFVWLSLARENGARGRALDNLVATLDRTLLETAQQRLAALKSSLGLAASVPAAPVAAAEAPAPAAPAEPAAAPVEDPIPSVAVRDDPALARVRSERDSLSAKLTELAVELATLRTDRERLAAQAADGLQTAQAARSELERAKQSLAALEQAPKPAPDTAALDQKMRELQAAQTDLESSRNFVREVEATLNRVTDQKTALEAQLAPLTQAKNAAEQQLAELASLKAALEQNRTELAASEQRAAALNARAAELEQQAAQPRPPTYPDLSGRVSELETALAAARQAVSEKPAAPAYPDLSGQVGELETALAAARQATGEKPAAPAYPDLSGRVAELEAQTSRLQTALLAARNSGPSYPDLSDRVRELEAQVSSGSSAVATARDEANRARQELAALSQSRATEPPPERAPAYPDLSGRVRELEARLAAVERPSAPAYPDLSGRVNELETALAESRSQLAAEQARPVPAAGASAPGADPVELQKQLAETEDKLAMSLRGYALLQKDRDALAAEATKSAEAVASERDALATQVSALTTEVAQFRSGATAQAEALNQAATLAADKNSLESRLAEVEARVAAAQAEAARATESLAALQRSSAQSSTELAAARTLVRQLQGSNSVLASENYQLKTMLSRTAGTPVPAAAGAMAAVPAARMHTVASGDSLSRISQRYYGAANRWQEIYNANRDRISNEGVLRVGTELRIP